jgi:multidrug efflux pump subunit AcrB
VVIGAPALLAALLLSGAPARRALALLRTSDGRSSPLRGAFDAVLEASLTRCRPILMTALATIAGIFPIALGFGAGGEARAPLGVAVGGGMFFSSVLTFFVVPATYLLVDRVRVRAAGAETPPAQPASAA